MKWFFPLLIILLAVWLRFHGSVQDIRFEPDEAFYSTFARAAALNGDWWLPGPLDKPPLTIYAIALAQVFVGESEFSARLPSLLAGILLLPVMVAAARAWYRRDETSRASPLPMIVLILTAFSTYALAFSVTAYTDGLMLLFMGLALWMAGRGRWGWAGWWLGLGFTSKPQAVYYLPLLLALGWAVGELTLRRAARFFAALLGIGLLILLWDSARPDTSIFALGAFRSTPDRLIRSDELIPRLQTLLTFGGELLGPRGLTGLLAAGGLIALGVRVVREARRRSTVIDLILLGFGLVFYLLHWLVAFDTYDRYLLPLLPPVILLASRGLEWFFIRISARWAMSLQILLIALLLVPAWNTVEGRRIINRDQVHYRGIDALADDLIAQPVATVIYDHWLGRELRYYLGQWQDKRMVYYPTPDSLVRDALALCEIGPRYFPAPADQPVGPWLEALRRAGFAVDPSYTSPQFIVYRIMPPWASRSDCS